MEGLFITFEGPDGSGKTTVCQMVFRRLLNEGIEAIHTREPGGIEIAEKIRDIILDPVNTAMDDDLNTPDALAAIFELVKEINTQGKEASKAALTKAAEVFDELTGVLGLLYNRKTNEVPAEVMELVERRAAAKKAKDWGTADALRAQITEMGWQVEDTAQGPKVSKLS